MAEHLDSKDIVTLEELALSSMWEMAALVEVLEKKGVLTKQDILDAIRELRKKNPQAEPRESSMPTQTPLSLKVRLPPSLALPKPRVR